MEADVPTRSNGMHRRECSRHAQHLTRRPRSIFAFNSQKKAVAAIESGAFTDEIIPIEAPAGRRKTVLFSQDEGPRADSNLEKLASLRAVFEKGEPSQQETLPPSTMVQAP